MDMEKWLEIGVHLQKENLCQISPYLGDGEFAKSDMSSFCILLTLLISMIIWKMWQW